MNLIVEEIYKRNTSRKKILDSQRERDIISLTKTIKSTNSKGKLALIAEFKRRSPSGFVNTSNIDVMRYFEKVSGRGVDAFSVLCEPDYFGGDYLDISTVQNFMKPILAKDFISNNEMILSSYNAGADVILLIAEFLPYETISSLADFSRNLGLEVILEFHSLSEIEKVNKFDEVIIGYNRRNLRTMKIEGEENKAFDLIKSSGLPVILESGMDSSNISKIETSKFDGVLIGSSILRDDDIISAIHSMRVSQ